MKFIVEFKTLTGPAKLEYTAAEIAKTVYGPTAQLLIEDRAAVSLVTLGIPEHGRVEISKVE